MVDGAVPVLVRGPPVRPEDASGESGGGSVVRLWGASASETVPSIPRARSDASCTRAAVTPVRSSARNPAERGSRVIAAKRWMGRTRSAPRRRAMASARSTTRSSTISCSSLSILSADTKSFSRTWAAASSPEVSGSAPIIHSTQCALEGR